MLRMRWIFQGMNEAIGVCLGGGAMMRWGTMIRWRMKSGVLVLEDNIPFSEPGLIAQCPPTSLPTFRPFYSPGRGVGCVIG